MTTRAKLVATAAGTALLAVPVVWPQLLGLAGTTGPAQIVAMRGVSTAAGALLLAVLLALSLVWRSARAYVLTVAAVVATATSFSAAVVAVRGLHDDPGGVGERPGDLRVLTFNTSRDNVAARDVAELVGRHDADVVVLPETSRATADEVAGIAGDYQVFDHTVGAGVTSATSLLIADDLGRYNAPEPYAAGALGSFTVRPDSAAAPPITAVHAYPPGAGSMQRWRADTAWAVRRCAGVEGAVVAGDFNATLDHPAFAHRGHCVDAADARDAAAVGTWPTTWPAWAGAPIDHVLVDGRAWDVVSFSVLDAVGASDHRPVLAVLRRR